MQQDPSGRKRFLIAVVGPTAVGKTAVTVELARHFQTEVLSADSRQFYREMELGTAKPSEDELSAVTHHFINHLSVTQDYNAGQFERDAMVLLDLLFANYESVIVTGGSGMYIDALLNGIDDMPEIDPSVRQTLMAELEEAGPEPLLKELARRDPEHFEKIDRKNPVRVVRALEIIRGTDRTYSSFRKGKKSVNRPFDVVKIGLQLPREELYDRIDRRMDQMIAEGLFDEAGRLHPLRSLNALQTVGYTEIFDFLEGKYDRAEAVRLLKRNSRRYAKRQMTWFTKDPDIRWFGPSEMDAITQYISARLDT